MPTGEERAGSGADPKTTPMTRALTAATDPARRLQELLREEGPGDEPASVITARPAQEPPVAPPPIADAGIKEPPADSLPTVPTPAAETVRLSITLDGARLDPAEYPGRDALPTRLQLEQTHRAYIFRDQWSKSETTPTWNVYMKRKTR